MVSEASVGSEVRCELGIGGVEGYDGVVVFWRIK